MKKTIKSLNIIIVLLPFLALLSTKSISDTETTSALTTIEIPTTLLPNHPTENVTLATVMKIQENVKKNNSNDENLKNIEGSSTTQDPKSLLIPPALVEAKIFQMNSSKKALKLQTPEEACPSFENAGSLTQTQLFKRLTHPCRFDRIQRPESKDDNGNTKPVDVYARAYIYFLQNLEAHDLQFKIHTLLQLRYVDSRLVFKEVAPNRTQSIVGEDDLRKELWVPHIFLANERDSSILGTHEKDILTSIAPDGTVIISTRIQATLYCSMNLRKFPFDHQSCQTVLESWMYNGSELVLRWEPNSPVTLSPDLHLTEYVLLNFYSNETMINADMRDLRHGAFAGNYSSLSFTVFLARQMGFYLLDYFLPSMMIVAISWVSFWLQADQSAPRIMLGTSTMLTFITLASAQGKTLPKVSYVKASEIWFMGCTGFIFGSLVEFAFVNTIWRRKKNVELKKVNSKYILKSTLTPRPTRKDMPGLQKSHSCSSLNEQATVQANANFYKNNLTVNNSANTIPTITTEDFSLSNGGFMNSAFCSSSADLQKNGGSRNNLQSTGTLADESEKDKHEWTTMTPQQISFWIDRRSRFVFPCAFLLFNICYWTFVYSI